MSRTDLYPRLAKRTQAWSFFCWYWGDAIAIDGLLLADDNDMTAARAHVLTQLNAWRLRAPVNEGDALAPGRAIVELVAAGVLDSQAMDRFVTAIDRLPVLDSGFPILEPQRPKERFGVCVDAIYHLPVAIAAYGRLTSDERRVASAVRMALATMQLLECEGGWAQWYDGARRANNAIPWSRGAGWAVLGLLDLLDVVDGIEGSEQLQRIAVQILERLAQTQEHDGNWAGVLSDSMAAVETSTAAFFVASALHPARRDRWTASEAVLSRAIAAVERSVDDDGIAQGVSCDILPEWRIGPYRTFDCEPSPWGQGAALRAAAAIRDRGR